MDLSVCRVCLRTEDLINIFENPEKTSKMQVQILSSTGSEIFEGDGMPPFMCLLCSHLIEIFHSYKQISKKAEMALKQYSFSNKKLPQPFQLPQEEKLLEIFIAGPELVDEGTVTEAVEVVEKGTQCNAEKKASESPPKKRKAVAVVEKETQCNANESPPKKRKAVETVEEPVKKVMKTEPAAPKKKPESTKREKVLNYTLKDVDTSPTVLYTEPSTESTQFQIVETKPRKATLKSGSKPRLLNKKALNPAMENVEIKQKCSLNEDEVIMEIVQSDMVSVVYACNYCERSFPLRRQLEIHEQDHFREREFACDICNGRFLSKHDLVKHLRIHTDPDQRFPWKCPICPKSFSRSNILKKHEETHEDQMKFQCEQCPKKFLVEADMEKHIVSEHEQKRKFTCQACSKSFKYKQGLERHARNQHSVVGLPFPCDFCTESFNTAAKLARHLPTHTGPRRFPCKWCPKTFSYSHHLSRHVRGHMKGTTPSNVETFVEKHFMCYVCEESYDKVEAFMMHSLEHFDNDGKCPICEEVGDSTNAEEHVRSHLNEISVEDEVKVNEGIVS